MERQSYINPSEIVSLKVTCKSCGYTGSFSLDQVKSGAVPYACPHCPKQWIKPRGYADNFIRNLAKWKLVTEKEGSDLGVELRLEIATGE